jgi:hypothetical protein
VSGAPLCVALDRADYALLVAVASALVATASLFWQVYNAIRIDRARVRLVVDPSMVTPGIDGPVVVS